MLPSQAAQQKSEILSSWLYFMQMGEKINLHHSLLQNNDVCWKDVNTQLPCTSTFTPTTLSRMGRGRVRRGGGGNSLQTFRKYCVCWQHAHPYSSISPSLIPQNGERVTSWSMSGWPLWEGDFLQPLTLYIQKLIIKISIPSPLLSAQCFVLFCFAQELEGVEGCIFLYNVCRDEGLWLLYIGVLISSEAGVWYYALKKFIQLARYLHFILFVCPTILSVFCLIREKGREININQYWLWIRFAAGQVPTYLLCTHLSQLHIPNCYVYVTEIENVQENSKSSTTSNFCLIFYRNDSKLKKVPLSRRSGGEEDDLYPAHVTQLLWRFTHTKKKNMLTSLNKRKTQVTHNSSSEVYTVQRDIIILCNT